MFSDWFVLFIGKCQSALQKAVTSMLSYRKSRRDQSTNTVSNSKHVATQTHTFCCEEHIWLTLDDNGGISALSRYH